MFGDHIPLRVFFLHPLGKIPLDVDAVLVDVDVEFVVLEVGDVQPVDIWILRFVHMDLDVVCIVGKPVAELFMPGMIEPISDDPSAVRSKSSNFGTSKD
jgi:hypothetical protein